jgi:RimJ/RimL family protein N-acetyltransferase
VLGPPLCDHGFIGWYRHDELICVREFEDADEAVLLAGRDDEWARWLGPGHEHPRPTASIVAEGQIVGWVDSDPEAPRLRAGETNLGYTVFPKYRQRGYATRALLLMLTFLATEHPDLHTATLLVNLENHASIRVAQKAGFVRTGHVGDEVVFTRLIHE